MLISEVIELVKGYCRGIGPAGMPIDPATSLDQVQWGPTDVECTGIVCCIWATSDVIREAAARGANLVIPHETLFWNDRGKTDRLIARQNRAFVAKRALLEETGITVWRFHDHIHSGIPSPTGDGTWADGILLGLVRRLGWNPVAPLDNEHNVPVYLVSELDGRPARELARDISARLRLNGARIIGDPDTPVHRVGGALHMNGKFDEMIIDAMDERGIDCLIAMETTDYTVLEYVQDSSQTGVPKCIISCGHFNIEDPGMEYMVTWLPKVLGEGAPAVSYVAAGDPFHYVVGA